MKRFLLFLFVFSFSLLSFAQCTLQLQNSDNCIGSTNNSFLQLKALSVPNPLSIVWSVSPSEGVNFGTINGSDNSEFQAVFSQSGVYTVSMSSDGCGVQQYEFVVYPLGSFQTNVLTDYSLCNGTQFIEFDVLNPGNFSSFQWSGIENVGDNTTNFSSEPSFSANFTNPQDFLLTIQVEDLNGCSYLDVFPVSVNAGPTEADFNFEVLSASDDCVLPGEDYSLDFVLNTSFNFQSFAPQTYLISPSIDSQVSQENFAIPVQVSFENECVIERSILHEHSIFYQTHFSTDFDGVLCAGEEITLINDSPHLTSSNSEYFTWSGIPSENILAESANSISFTYDVDGEYTWALAYDDGSCSSQFDTTITVDVDLIDVLYSVDNSIVCQDAINTEFSNESTVGNASYSYAWSVVNQTSGFSYESAEENPVILLSGTGSYDVSLEISSINCSASSEILGMVSVVGSPYFTTDFDGVLCAGEEITLINESSHLNASTNEYFTWSGIPSENILAESANSISFTYDVDGEYTWTLAYDDGSCSSQFDTTITVDLELIDVLYSVDNSNVCQDAVNIEFSNESTVGNASYSYAWSVVNQASGVSYESAEENPVILLIGTGSYDVSLEISSLNCSASSEILGMVIVVGLPYFTTDFDGVLCAGEEITLINESPHLTSSTSEYFTWSGIPSENILAESANSISFTYDVDGEYNWILTYDDGLCVGIYDSIYSVNVDFIEPLLSENLNQLSCEFSSSLALSDQTVLDSGTNDSYLYTWNMIPTTAEFDSSISLSSNEFTPTFTINSSQAQSYSLSLDIVNQNTNCSGSKYYEDFFSVGGILVDMVSEPLIVCDQAWLVTNDFIISDEIDQYDYFWTFSFEGTEQYSSTLFSDSVFLDQPGSYDVTLEVSDSQCSSGTLNSLVTVYPNPTIENTLLDVVVCSLPLDSTFVISENTPTFGSETFEWVLLGSSNSILATNDGPNFSYLFESNDSYIVQLALVNDSSLCTTNTEFSIDIESIENTISSNTIETCLPSDVFLSTENNALLNSFEWNLYSEETLVYEGNTSQISADLPVGVYDVELITETNNGCVSVVVNENFIAVNNYSAVINAAPLNICFNGALNVSQEFSSLIAGELFTVPVDVSSFTWNLQSSDPSSVTQTSVDTFSVVYEFTKPGSYELVYTALIDGTSSTCSYSDTLNFNVGVDASITYDNTICVGEEFSASTDADTWSSGKIYEWSGSPDLLINTPSLASTVISSEASINPDILSNYNLNLTVTNDVGCWETTEEIVEVYQVSADFTLSDSIIHCNSQEIVLTSLYNTYISNWTWLISDNTNETVYNQTNPVFNHSVTGDAYSNIELTVQSEHGCTAVKLYQDIVYATNYTVEIDTVPSNICFNGALSTSQNFISSLNSDSLGLLFDLISYNWNIVSSNSAFATQTAVDTFSVVYEFTKPGLYYLEYAAIIDGTNINCTYTDTLEFNVGVDASITSDNTICVGEEFFATTNADTWSSGKTYEWSGTSNLLIETPNLFSTAFSTETQLGAGVTTNYELSLTVTNDVGCWEIETENIEVYEVVADFTVSESILNCSPQEIELTSLNNSYVNNWDWIVFIEDSNAIENNPSAYSTIQTPSFLLDSVAIYDFSLLISSVQGCSDVLYLDSVVILDGLEPEIEDVDGVICFNGDSVINKHFVIDYNSLYNNPINAMDYSWVISPEVSITYQDENNLYLAFNESNEYTITYTFTLDSGNGESCFYSTEKLISIGVNASIFVPEIICEGAPFEAAAQVSIGIGATSVYEWSTSSSIDFSNPNSLQSNITANGNLSGSQVVAYELGFKVTNDLGCWEEQQAFIEVYNTVADFYASDSAEVCAPAILSFSSLYNNYVSSYEWSYEGENYAGDYLSKVYTQNADIIGDFFDEMAIYDFTLSINSVHGCSDTLTKSSYLDIKRPYPYFIFEADYACDDEVIHVIDSSYFSSNIGLYTQNTIFDSTFYNLNSSTFIAYDFPYNQTTELSYNFPITLNAYLGQCSRSHSDTVTIFAKPVLNVELSDSIGCPPFLVNFIDSTTFVVVEEASYFWDFGDGSVAFTKNATHIYTIPGVYQVYHSVTSADGCTSDTILSNTIRVFEYPEADFTFVSDLFCYGEADVSFENTSIYVTDSIYSLWNVNEGILAASTLEDIVVHFDTTGVYQVNLQITDLHGCVDNSSQLVGVNILDTLVNDVSIDFVTISDDGITVVWEDNPDDYFESINVYTRENFGDWTTIYTSQSIVPNSYFHENAFTSILNEYAIAQMDSCGYFSDSSTVHSPVLLEVNSEIYQTVRLNWTNYIGWSDVEYYEVFRSEDAQNYDLIASLSPDTLFYTDSNLCNILYSYYIVAHHPNGEFMSRSNKKFIEPMFVDFTIPLELSYTSVFNNNYILTEWDVMFESPITYYKLDRWDAYFGWLEEVALISESPYLDRDVGVFNQTYSYRISYADQCGNVGPESNLGTSILLKGEQYASHYYLSWNAYEGWLEGVENYVVQYFNNSSQNYENIEVLPNTSFDYTDADLAKVGIDSSYCYRVIAISSENNQIMSISNDRCFISAPNNYFPNAFSPNNDGLNDTFKFEGLFAKSMTINIFDRQGGLVYSSKDVDFEWDGTFKDTGVECANGTYSLHFEIVGFDGTKIRNDYPIFLIR